MLTSYSFDMASQDKTPNPNDPATKLDIAEMRSELKEDMGNLGTEFKEDMGNLRAEFKEDMGNLRSEFKEDISNLRAELLKWTLTTVITTGAMIVAALKLL